MSLLTLGLGLIFPAAGIGGAVAKFGARVVFGKIGGWASRGFAFLRSLDPRTLALIFLMGVVVFIAADLRHTRKVLTGEQAWGSAVMVEVNRAHGCEPLRRACAVEKGDAAERIHQLTDNARGWRADVEAQNTSQRSSAASAAARDAAARAGAATTAEQKAREPIRAGLRSPDRKTGVSSNEWSKM